MSMVTIALLFDRYGPRMNMDQLAALMEIAATTLYNQISAGVCPVKTYREGKARFADVRDVAAYLDGVLKVLSWVRQWCSENKHLSSAELMEAGPVAWQQSQAPAPCAAVRAVSAGELRRVIALRNAQVTWANGLAIKAIYAEAKRRTLETGVTHHVDHEIPLQHPLVCGLHVESNLRVMTGADNMRKHNSFTPC